MAFAPLPSEAPTEAWKPFLFSPSWALAGVKLKPALAPPMPPFEIFTPRLGPMTYPTPTVNPLGPYAMFTGRPVNPWIVALTTVDKMLKPTWTMADFAIAFTTLAAAFTTLATFFTAFFSFLVSFLSLKPSCMFNWLWTVLVSRRAAANAAVSWGPGWLPQNSPPPV